MNTIIMYTEGIFAHVDRRYVVPLLQQLTNYLCKSLVNIKCLANVNIDSYHFWSIVVAIVP